MTASSGEEAEGAAVAHVDHLHVARCRRAATRAARPPPRSRTRRRACRAAPAWCRAPGRRTSAAARPRSPRPRRPGFPPSAAPPPPRHARSSNAGNTKAQNHRHPERMRATPHAPRSPRRWPASSSGSRSSPSTRTARSQVRWLSPTWSSDTDSGATPSSDGEVPLQPDRHVAQPDRAVPGVEQRPGDDADRVGEVDEPRARRGPPPGELGDLQHERHGAQRLGEPARPGRLLSHAAEVERPRLVPVPRRLPADPELDEHRGRAVDPVFGVGGPPDGRLVPVRPHDPRGHRPDRGQPRLVGVDQDQLGDLRREPPEPVGELGRVGGAAADDRELHENAFTFAPDCATWHATSPAPSGSSSRRHRRALVDRDRAARLEPAAGLAGRSPSAARRARRPPRPCASRLGGGAFGSGTAESSSWV